MCGLAGYLSFDAPPLEADVLWAMGTAMTHRGPDSADIHHDDEGRVGLSHRRLSIMDLSAAGAQPMTSHSGRYVMVYNGAIYNHLDLRQQLAAKDQTIAWRGVSDTETMLALFDAKGVEVALSKLTGMFAFAVWDRQERSLTLARDRLGEKPIYYGVSDGRLLFGSDLIAFRQVPGFAPDISPTAVKAMLNFGCVPGPLCIYQGFAKLPAGHLLTFPADSDPAQAKPRAYWSLPAVIASIRADQPAEGSYEDQLDRTEAVLRDVVQSQLLSDVPVGSFLSGGIDSSLITALMKQTAGGEVLTYSIGFENARFNEATQARLVADALGTRHHEWIVTEKDALSVIPELTAAYSEPFADPSQIPTMLLSRMTAEHVGVALSGDGGDEMFGGYNRHVMAPRLWQRARRIPGLVRGLGAGSIQRIQGLARADSWAARTAVRAGLPVSTFDKLAQFADAFGNAQSFREVYLGLIGAGGTRTAPPLINGPDWQGAGLHEAEQLMLWDAGWYLPDDIMVKVDRASMFSSLETRAPFLDMRAVEQAWRLPLCSKIKSGKGKQILRDILYRHVPRELVERPKQGFTFPLNAWLRGALKDWGAGLMDQADQLGNCGVDAAALRKSWHDHQSGRRTEGNQLWSALMMIQWLNDQAQVSSVSLKGASR